MTVHNRSWLYVLAGGTVAGLAVYAWRRNSAYAEPVRHARKTHFTNDRSQVAVWRFDQRFRVLPAGKALRIELASPAIVHWTTNQWDKVQDTRTADVGRDVHAAELETTELPPNTRIQFTFYWPKVNRWEGEDFELRIAESGERSVRSATERTD